MSACVKGHVSAAQNRLEGEEGDFRRAVEADWDVDGTEAAADEYGGVLAAGGTGNDRELACGDRAEPGQHDLPAVGVAADHQRDRERARLEEAHRGVREEDCVG